MTLLDQPGLDPDLLARAKADDAGARRVALIQAYDDAERYRDLFVAAARDPDAGVRLEAARGLEGLTTEAAVGALVALLDDADADVCATAAEALSEIPVRDVGPMLVRHLSAATGAARGALLAALRELRLPEALEPARAALHDALPDVRREAIGVLGYLQDESAAPDLAERATRDDSAVVRRTAVGALAFSQAPQAREAIIAALNDGDWQTREAAAETVGRMRAREAVTALIAALSDSFWQVRLKATQALGLIGDAGAARALVAAFDHPIGNLRREVVNALATLQTPEASALFEKAASDPDIDVRKAVARALATRR